jgi:hypothetical protein
MPKNGILLRQVVLNALFHVLLYFFARQYRLFDTLISEGLDVNKILFFCLTAVSFCLIQYVLTRRAIPIRDIGKNKALLIVAAFLAVWLILTYPLIVRMPGAGAALYIESLNEKNALSKGTEVWIDAIYIDGRKVKIDDVVSDSNDWKVRDEVIYCAGRPASFRVHADVDHEIKVVFIKHPWSGKVKVRFVNGASEILDLYSGTTGTAELVNAGRGTADSPGKGLVHVFLFFIVYVYTLALLLLLDGVKIRANLYGKLRLKTVLMYMAPSLIVWCISWYAFYPAVMTGDSLREWDQIQSLFDSSYMPLNPLDNRHPVSFVLFMAFLTRVWNNPGVVVIFQILSLSLLISCFLSRLEQLGVKRGVLFLLLLFFTLSPVNNIYLATIRKDVPYSIALLTLTFLFFEIYVSGGTALKSKPKLVLLVLSLLATSFRHNGIVVFAFALPALFLLEHSKPFVKRVSLIIVITIALSLILRVVYFDVLHVLHFPKGARYSFIAHHIGAVVSNENGVVREADKEIVYGIMPEYQWKKYFTPFHHNGYQYNREIEELTGRSYFEQLTVYKDKILPVYLHMLFDNPGIVANDWLNLTSLLWRFKESPGGYTHKSAFRIKDDNPYVKRLGLQNLDNPLRRPWETAIKFTQRGAMKNIFWRHGPYLFLLLVSIYFIFRNQGLKGLLVTVPCAANIGSLFISMIAQDFRYVYASVIIVPFLLLISLVVFSKERGASGTG